MWRSSAASLPLYLALWSLGTNLSMRGDPYPLPYVPLLNPLDLAQVFVLLVLARYGLHVHKARYALLAGRGADVAARVDSRGASCSCG